MIAIIMRMPSNNARYFCKTLSFHAPLNFGVESVFLSLVDKNCILIDLKWRKNTFEMPLFTHEG